MVCYAFLRWYGNWAHVFGVAEPVMHYLNPPVGEPQTVEAAKEAMRLTFFHWGYMLGLSMPLSH